ncbi:MAG: flagellar filament capping protein FliD [Candidatus Sericytochromatia bacterium]|nr:flagellar filament capping protein FliD [Candidatus Sericytochromatia bacterium]
MDGLSGLASGLDTKSLIENLLSLDRRPISSLNTRKTTIQSQADAYRALNTKLQTLQAKAFDLTQLNQIIARSATSADQTKATGAASSDTPTGSYSLEVVSLATSTKVASAGGAGNGNGIGGMGAILTGADGPSTLAALNTAGRFSMAVTSGTFTVDGQSVIIDVNTDTLDSVFTKINVATGGAVSARVGNSAPDGAGFDNKVIVSKSGGGALAVGSSGDGSNFLKALKLDNALPGTDPTAPANAAVTSTGVVGTVLRNGPLNAANFAQSVGLGNVFSVNGVNINYDVTKDTLMDVVNRVNASTAGVTASYDSVQDKVILQSRTTGSGSITLDDKGGSLLKAMGLANNTTVTGTATAGANAVYKVNGASFSATSNTVSDAGGVQGLSLTLKDVTTTPVLISVGVDTGKAQTALQAFADAYNAFADDVEKYTTSSNPKQKALLQGLSTVTSARDRILAVMNTPVNVSTGSTGILGELGLTSGAPGTNPVSPGSKGIRYTLDATKLAAALTNNPNRVAEITGAIGNNGVFGQLNTFLRQTSSSTGAFSTAQTSAKDQIKGIDEQIDRLNKRIDTKRVRLQTQFNAMEKAMAKSQSQQSAISGMMSRSQ